MAMTERWITAWVCAAALSAGPPWSTRSTGRHAPVPAHGSWKEAYGYRIDTPDRAIVIAGDTRPVPALVVLIVVSSSAHF